MDTRTAAPVQLTVRHPPPSHPTVRDVLDDYGVWLSTPHLAFTSWINRQPLKNSSKRVYAAMFKKCANWMARKGIGLERWDAEHLADFLRSHDITKHQRYRYVRLVERAFIHLAALGYRGNNPGTRAARTKIGVGLNDPTRFLTDDERAAVIRLIGAGPDESRQEEIGESWIEERDRALVAVLIGGGLKVAQVRAVTVNCTDIAEGWIRVHPGGAKSTYRARLLPYAVLAVRRWLEVRERCGITDQHLFPADRAKGTFKPRKATGGMHAASIFRRTQRVLALAGIQGERACAQTLRNTYAAQLIDNGEDDLRLVDWMGLVHELSAMRLRIAYGTAKTAAAEQQQHRPPGTSAPLEQMEEASTGKAQGRGATGSPAHLEDTK
jgi:integrase